MKSDSVIDCIRCHHVSGDGSANNYLNVGIVTGGVTVTMRLGSGTLDMFIKPNRIRFDDNQWHKISVTRKVQGVRVFDGSLKKKNVFSVFGIFKHVVFGFFVLSFKRVFVRE